MSYQNKQHGFTFIEFMGYLLISSIFALAAITATKRVIASSNLSQAKSSADLVMQASQQYFEMNCASNSNLQPTISNLVSNNLLLKPSFADTKLIGTLTPSIVWATSTKSSRIVVTGTFPVGVNPASYIKSLGADRVSGQNIIWDEPPNLITRIHGQEILQNLKLYGVNSCR